MYGTVKSFLSGIPVTERDPKVVTMRGLDEDAMPPAMAHTWRTIRQIMSEIDGLEKARAAEKAAFESTQAMFESVMRRAEQELQTRREKLQAEQERVITMIAALGIKIVEDEA